MPTKGATLSSSRHGFGPAAVGPYPAAGITKRGREIPIMSLASHLDELKRKHSDIEREIDEALAHPSVDDLEIVQLKRRKLAIKDEMEKLRVGHTTH